MGQKVFLEAPKGGYRSEETRADPPSSLDKTWKQFLKSDIDIKGRAIAGN